MKKKIGIDIDEVVVEFMKGYIDFHNKKHGTNFNLGSITNYHLWKSGFHKTKEESVRDVMEFQDSEDFNFITLIEGVKNCLKKISMDYNIIFITSRPEELKEKTRNFFYKHFPKNGYNFIFSGEIYGGKTKSQICLEEGISIMVEDNADYALDCAKRGIKTFLLEKPWNKNYENHENIIKVKNWEEILNKLNSEKLK